MHCREVISQIHEGPEPEVGEGFCLQHFTDRESVSNQMEGNSKIFKDHQVCLQFLGTGEQ